MHDFLTSSFFKGAITGLVGAMAVDYHAFQKFKSDEEFKGYNWKLAFTRWAMGMFSGAITGSGLGLMG